MEMDSTDIEISKEIGQYLYGIAPKDAKTILMIAALSSEGDVAQFEFYSNNGIEEHQFYNKDTDRVRLFELAAAHQRFLVANNQPAWLLCEFMVNVDLDTFSMNLGYEDCLFSSLR